MDYVTRQFINLTKKFRKELRPLLSKLSRTLDEQTKAIRESTKAAKTQQSTPPEIVSHVHLPESVEIHKNAQDTASDKRYQKKMIWLSSLTLIAIVVYAVLVYLQWREMIAATGAAQQAIVEARRNRLQAEKSLSATIEQFRLEQRAWVGMSAYAISQFNPAGIVSTITFTNNGKTPAHNVKAHARIEVTNKVLTGPSKQQIEILNGPPWEQKPDIAPTVGIVLSVGKTPSGQRITDENRKIVESLNANFQAVKDQTLHVYYFGIISYEDINQRPHTTNFCVFIGDTTSSPPGLNICPEFNKMD